MSNKQIRRAIKNYIKHYGMQDTRIVIDKFSKAFIQQNNVFQEISVA